MIPRISVYKINIGDILYLNKIKVNGNLIGSRPFVVWYKDLHNFSQIMMYEISSKEKIGDKYPYNVEISKSIVNGLNQNSHVKADQLFIYCENNMKGNVLKIGELELDKYAESINEKSDEAIQNHEYYFYDQSNNGKQLIGW